MSKRTGNRNGAAAKRRRQRVARRVEQHLGARAFGYYSAIASAEGIGPPYWPGRPNRYAARAWARLVGGRLRQRRYRARTRRNLGIGAGWDPVDLFDSFNVDRVAPGQTFSNLLAPAVLSATAVADAWAAMREATNRLRDEWPIVREGMPVRVNALLPADHVIVTHDELQAGSDEALAAFFAEANADGILVLAEDLAAARKTLAAGGIVKLRPRRPADERAAPIAEAFAAGRIRIPPKRFDDL